MKTIQTIFLTFITLFAQSQDFPEHTDGLTPVQFMDLKSERIDESIIFTWRTASEINNDYFTIEVSQNAEEWRHAGSIPGSGTISTITSYSWIYRHTKTAYFRLSQTDYDGTMEYLKIIRVEGMKESQHRYYDLQGKPSTKETPGPKIVYAEGKAWKEFRIN